MILELQNLNFIKNLIYAIIIFSLDEQRALRPLLISVAKKFYEKRARRETIYIQNKPNFRKDGNAPTSLLLTTNDQRLATREAQNKPKQTQFKPNSIPHRQALTPIFLNPSTKFIQLTIQNS